MTTPPPATQKKVEFLLGNLATGLLPHKLDAIKELAALDFSSTDIVVALLLTRNCDKNSSAREAAAQALNVPVHQILWQEHSDTIASKLAKEERIVEARLGTLSWYQAWSMAIFRPSVKTFEQISLSRDATLTTAFRWIWISNLLAPLIVVALGIFEALLDMGEYGRFATDRVLLWLIGLAFLIVGTAMGTLIEMLGIRVWHIVAGLFRGKGTYASLVNAVAAFFAPLILITTLISVVSTLFTIRSLIWLFIPIQIYTVVLYPIAIKSVYRFGWVQAIASYILGALLLLACAVLLVAAGIGVDTYMGHLFYEVIQRSRTVVP